MGAGNDGQVRLGHQTWRECAPVVKAAVLAAVVWTFGTHTSFDSRFTFFTTGSFSASAPVSRLLVICAFSAGLALTRWDAFPRAFKYAAVWATALSAILQLPLYFLHVDGTILNALLSFTLALGSAGVMTLWYETLMKTGSPVRILTAIVLAWALFYAFRFALSALPPIALVVIVACAPLALLIDARQPLTPTADPVAFLPARLVSIDVLRLVLVGVAGGIVSAMGGGLAASAQLSLLENPRPLFMFLTGAYLFLAIQSATSERYLKASFFFAANFVWDVSMLLGGVFFEFAPGVSAPVLTTIAYVLFFSAFATFLIRPVSPIRSSESRPADEEYKTLARANGLTERETEVLSLLLQGRSVPFVEERLRISEGTARTHVNSIYRKLNVHCRQDLLNLFLEDSRAARDDVALG